MAAQSVDAKDRFESACLAYVAFGRANPGVYRLMFASTIVPTTADGPLRDAADAAFQFLLRGVSAYAPPEQSHTLALWVWSTLHGLVMLEANALKALGDAPIASTAVIGRLVQAVKVCNPT